MSDLISRCELFNRLAPVQTLGEAYGIIQGMDTVDAVPVVHGRWEWDGYWVWENNTIMMHCRDGSVTDIRDTEFPAYTFRNIAQRDWMVVEDGDHHDYTH